MIDAPSGTPSCSTVECVRKPFWASACRNGSCALVHSPSNLRLTCSAISPSSNRWRIQRSKPYADLPAQNFGEVLWIGARVWVQPGRVACWGTANSNVSLYEKTFRENYTQLLNYLGFEVEARCPPTYRQAGFTTAPVLSAPMAVFRRQLRRCSACATAGTGHTQAGERRDAAHAGV